MEKSLIEGASGPVQRRIEKWFTDVPPARVAMEAGTHSIWISEQLQELGHEVIVAGRSRTVIGRATRSMLRIWRYARLDPNILRPLDHHTVAQQEALTLIGARAGVGFGMVNSAITNNAVSGMPLSQAEVAAAIASTSRGGSVAVTGTIIDAIHKGSMTFTPVTHLAWSAFSFSTRMGFERALGSHQGKPLCTC